jgi:DNA-binding GntR family transcriptional regulator
VASRRSAQGAAPGVVRRPPASKADYVHEALREEIVDGVLPPGSAIVQEEIAARLGVSITPVREALRRLESDGLISYRAHHGATVSELGPEATEELYLLRAAVEGLIARLAATKITEPQLAELHEVHKRMVTDLGEVHGGRDAAVLAGESRTFHRLVAEAGGPAFLAAHVRSIWQNNPVPVSVSLWNDPGNVRVFLRAHADLLRALESRDAAEAERIMIAHLHTAADARRRGR